jgi:hypothetical protein
VNLEIIMATKYPAQQRYIEKNRDWARDVRNKQHRERRLRVIKAYGDRCVCCGETNLEFLCIDHINGNGNADRKIHGWGSKFYSYLIREGFPEGFRVLCHNCNHSMGSYGYCPHGNLETHDRDRGRSRIYP